MQFRLGRLERSILRSAAAGPVQLNAMGPRTGRAHNRRTAAASLVRHGLASLSIDYGEDCLGRVRWGLVWLELSKEGCSVLARFDRELASGRVIRWSRHGIEAHA
jgi:hypothetical protein